ncbi:MAG TPA: hypothetical protein VGP51_05630 [Nocardioidaceae bacterium]|nr:hypothetical protein [Actinomycetota bacterium]HEV8055948.1 hypothetical protein [Nocardioidaceae bacterium]
MSYLLMALAGFSIGGAIATWQQQRARWVPVVFVLAAGGLLWGGLAVSETGA